MIRRLASLGIRYLIKFVVKLPGGASLLRSVHRHAVEEVKALSVLTFGVPEATSLNVRRSTLEGRRLNLLIPALSSRHVFGGIATALRIFNRLGPNFDNLRIILTDESDFSAADNRDFSHWAILSLDSADQKGPVIVPAGGRAGESLAVSEGDVFIASAWWTARITKRIVEEQRELFGLDEVRPYVYLIQDFEPGFYNWSSRYAFAEATYHDKDGCIAVFNTSILRKYFEERGYFFRQTYCFEPVLAEGLRARMADAGAEGRRKRVLVYGRPGVARNAFEIIIMALNRWCTENPGLEWEFVSAGEVHAPVELGGGYMLESLGKLSMDEYASELCSCHAGLSLMISPHPSYPPLEMAAFGMHVITNSYPPKDLSLASHNIRSVSEVSPENVAAALDDVLKNPATGRSETLPESDWFERYKSGVEPFVELESLKQELSRL